MLELHAAHLRGVHGRSAKLAFVVEQAAKSDKGVAALWRQMNETVATASSGRHAPCSPSPGSSTSTPPMSRRLRMFALNEATTG